VEEAIRIYEDQCALACGAALACLDPADVSRVMGGGCPDPAAELHGVAILRLLREMAADGGPVPTSLDGQDSAIEIADDREGQHLLDPSCTE
jgi:hypothetical protein